MFFSPRACACLADSQENSRKTIKPSVHKLGFCRRNRGLIERDISCLSAVNWGNDTLINPRPYQALAAGIGAEAWLSQALGPVLQHQALPAWAWPIQRALALPSVPSAWPSLCDLRQPLCLSKPASLSAKGENSGAAEKMAQSSVYSRYSLNNPTSHLLLSRAVSSTTS